MSKTFTVVMAFAVICAVFWPLATVPGMSMQEAGPDRYFCPDGASGVWSSVDSVWKEFGNCSGGFLPPPTAQGKATITSGKTCNVDTDAAVCDRLEVKSSAILNVQSQKKVTMDGDGDSGNSTVAGIIYLQGSESRLAITSNNQTLVGSGSGKIVGQDSAAEITVSDGETLTNQTTIEGILKIKSANSTDVTTFHNEGTVHAKAGVLQVNTWIITDELAAIWKVSGSAASVLRTTPGSSSVPELFGSFEIHDGGMLDVEGEGLTTTGSLLITSGVVDTYVNGVKKTATFGEYDYAP